MADVLHAMGIAGSILLPIVLLILIASITAVKRGEASMGHGAAHHAEAVAAAPAAPGKAAGGKLIPRRSMISWMTLAWAAFSASMLAAATATGRFMFPNVLFEPPPTFKAGYPSELQQGIVDERFKPLGVWLVKDNDVVTGALGIYALSTVCTHLGCTPNWLAGEQKFKCPCHGSGYYKNGINFEGPTPRPLERFAIELAEDGQIRVDKSRKFQYEKGEWVNPQSFLKV
jgi:cytochrome b6-f complex iron-sulfur subunit